MPSRKEKHKIHFKPINHNVHSSLSSRSSTPPIVAANSSQEALPESVTARIEHLRRAQAPIASSSVDVAERLRPSIPTSRRRVAGPPPPRSWIEGDVEAKLIFKHGAGGATQPGERARRPQRLDYFPGLNPRHAMSLEHVVLKSLARDFDWHVEYDHSYLSTLPVELNTLLLSYIASYGPEAGISFTGLKMLMLSPLEGEDGDVAATGSAELIRLDLGGSIGRGLTLKQLERLWQVKAQREAGPSSPVESWDMEESLPPTIASSLRFPALTHLSLAYPGHSTSWSDLLHFSRHLGALTHLSLAFWPAPTLASSSSINSAKPPAQNEADSSSDIAHILRLLSRATPSLTYLSLDGCQEWWQALRYISSMATPARLAHRQTALLSFDIHPPSSSGSKDPIWIASWRNITILSLSQCWIPKDVDTDFLFHLYDLRGRTLAAENTNDVPPSLQHRLLQRSMTLRPPHEPTALPVPNTGDAVGLPRREFPIPASRVGRDGAGLQSSQHAPAGEAYTIHASPTIAQSILARTQRQQWCKNEIESMKVESFIRSVRRAVKKGDTKMEVLHGWEKEDLLRMGYEEEVLWSSGFD